MNEPTLRDLRDQIADLGPSHFNLSIYLSSGGNVHVHPVEVDFDNCGTVGCIIGHGAVLLQKANAYVKSEWTDGWTVITQKYFDLSDLLVYGFWAKVPYGEGTLQKHAEGYQESGFNSQESQYYAVLDWLDVEVKKREEISS